ncbi:Flavin-dependent monooxygenase, oxygenase subunit HsaA [Halioglobus japonicus]|nr:Flavin-dependent monooxygenase, oxygenase subunit HsaA [Halioglobus japonicus]
MTDEKKLLEAAADLAKQCCARGDEIEQARRLPPDISLELARAGFYRMGVPKAVGGLESPPALSSKVFETLATGDASAAWVAFIGATSGTTLSAIPESAARKVFSAPETLITGVYAPTGRAEKTEGGFRVSGKWQWGSGSQNAAWVLGGCMLFEDGEPMLDQNGRPRMHMVLMPQSDVQFLDTWHVSGLCGTGSLDYQVEGLFVPEDQVVGYLNREAEALSPLYAFPSFTFLALGIGAVCLGIARAAIDELLALALSKKRVGARKTVAEQQVSQIKLAQAEADLRSARLFYYDTLQEMWESAITGQPFLVEQRRNLRLATTNAVIRSVGVVDEMYNLGGGSAVYRGSRLQRHFRDIHVAKTHIMVSQSTLETIGAHFFGLEPNISAL